MKLFVVSDIHGFYDELREALDGAGFDSKNEEHLLIVCGDTTDRGPKPSEVISYLSQLMNKNKCIVVKGNHESLVLECIERGYPYSYDYSNGTFDTICELGNANAGKTFGECCIVAEGRFKAFVNKMVHYFETKRYVFCHGFIPVNCDDEFPMYYQRNRKFSKNEDWRYAHNSEWEQAMWFNGMQMAMDGFTIEKCIVVGHYHASWGHAKMGKCSEFGEDADFSPFYYQDKLIAIDGCTAHTGKINVLVLEDELI